MTSEYSNLVRNSLCLGIFIFIIVTNPINAWNSTFDLNVTVLQSIRKHQSPSIILSRHEIISHHNWPTVLINTCWYHEVRVNDPSSICSIGDIEMEAVRERQCTLMHMFLSLRIYHPVAGPTSFQSMLKPLRSEERTTTSLYDAVGQEKIQFTTNNDQSTDMIGSRKNQHHLNIPSKITTVLSSQMLRISSRWSLLPYHQQLGIKGLVTLFSLLITIIVMGLYHDGATYTTSLKTSVQFFSHFKSIFAIKETRRQHPDRFLFFDGLRVISMAWIVLGHSILYWATFRPFAYASKLAFDMAKNPQYYILFASIFGVDNFFYISGFLVGYQFRLYFDKLYKSKFLYKSQVSETTRASLQLSGERECPNHFTSSTLKPSDWTNISHKQTLEDPRKKNLFEILVTFVVIILQRYSRLMAVNSLIIFTFLSINWHTMRTPAGSQYLQTTNIACSEVLPSILMVSNNFIQREFVNECFGWTWYLSNDFQFFVVGLLLVILSLLLPCTFFFILGILICSSLAISGCICQKFGLGVTVDRFASAWYNIGTYVKGRQFYALHPLMDYFYVKPWTRINPYLVGLAIGVILAKCKLKKAEEAPPDYSICATEENAKHRQKKGQLNPDEKTSIGAAQNLVLRNSSLRNAKTIQKSASFLITGERKDSVWLRPEIQRCKSLPSIRLLQSNCRNNVVDVISNPPSCLVQRWLTSYVSSTQDSTHFELSLFSHIANVGNSGLSKFVTRVERDLSISSAPTTDTPRSCVSSRRSRVPVVRCKRALSEQVHPVAQMSKCYAYHGENHSDETRQSKKALQSHVFVITHLPLPIQYLLQNYWLLLSSAFGIPIMLITGAHIANHYPWIPWSSLLDAWFMGISRTLWGISLASFTLLMVFTDYPYRNRYINFFQIIIKYVKSVSSHPYLSPISKLSFGIYLLHPILVFWFYGSGFGPPTFIGSYLVGYYFLALIAATVCATALAVFIEIPLKHILDGFFKVLLSSSSRSLSSSQSLSSSRSLSSSHSLSSSRSLSS